MQNFWVFRLMMNCNGEPISIIYQKNLASGSYAINAVKRLFPIHNLKQLYFSLIHSHLSYGLLLWGSAFEYRRKKVTKIQKKSN